MLNTARTDCVVVSTSDARGLSASSDGSQRAISSCSKRCCHSVGGRLLDDTPRVHAHRVIERPQDAGRREEGVQVRDAGRIGLADDLDALRSVQRLVERLRMKEAPVHEDEVDVVVAPGARFQRPRLTLFDLQAIPHLHQQ